MFTEIKKLQNKKGFTLIELIIVIAILGILASIAIPKLDGFTNRAKEAADVQLSEIIKRAILIELLSDGINIAGGKESGNIIVSNNDDGKLQYTSNNIIPADIGTTMEGLVDATKSSLQYYNKIVFTINKNSQEITVTPEL